MEEVPLLITLLDKAVRQYALYGPVHPQTGRVVKELEERLVKYFGDHDRLTIEVRRDEFLWEEEPILDMRDRENNYVQEMYIDGIRRLEFLPGVSGGELVRLASVISKDVRNYETKEDDTVTMLWKQNLQHIRYESVDVYVGDLDALLRESTLVQDMLESQADEQKFLAQFVEHVQAGDQDMSLLSSIAHLSAPSVSALPPPPIEHFMSKAEEFQLLKEEASRLPDRDCLPEVQAVYGEILEGVQDENEARVLARSYSDRVESFLAEGNIVLAIDWLSNLRKIGEHVHSLGSPIHPVIAEEIGRLSDPAIYQRMVEGSEGLPGTPEQWTEYLSLLGETAAKAVCELLRHVQQETFRTILVDLLVNRAPGQIETYKAHPQSEDSLMIRDMIRVLSQLSEPGEIPELVRPFFLHESPEVRGEVVRSTARMSRISSRPIRERALRDAEPSVRRMALHMISRISDGHFVRILADEVSKDEFSHREFEEKKRLMIALARCGGTGTLDFFDQVVTSGSTDQEIRIAALYGIVDIKDERSEKLLKKYASTLLMNKGVKDTARDLWERKAIELG